MKETSINLRISKATREALERLAEADKRKLSAYVALVLDHHVDAMGRAAKAANLKARLK